MGSLFCLCFFAFSFLSVISTSIWAGWPKSQSLITDRQCDYFLFSSASRQITNISTLLVREVLGTAAVAWNWGYECEEPYLQPCLGFHDMQPKRRSFLYSYIDFDLHSSVPCRIYQPTSGYSASVSRIMMNFTLRPLYPARKFLL